MHPALRAQGSFGGWASDSYVSTPHCVHYPPLRYVAKFLVLPDHRGSEDDSATGAEALHQLLLGAREAARQGEGETRPKLALQAPSLGPGAI